jgi:hypothetical protein
MAPSAAPAPTTVCSSSMKRMIWPFRLGDLLEHGLEPLLELAAVLRAGDERAHVEREDLLLLQPSGTSPRTMRCASPSTMAVLPTPGSPMRTGLFLVRRESTWMTRRTSSSRPMTGSSLPLAGQIGQVAAVAGERLVGRLRVLRGDPLVAAHLSHGAIQRVLRGAQPLEQLRRGGAPVSVASASSRCSVLMYSSCSRCASACAESTMSFMRGERRSRRRTPSAGRRAAAGLGGHARRVEHSFRRIDGTMPPLCSTSATSRCSGVTSACVSSPARFCAVTPPPAPFR